jgi:hypothetical protein
MVKKNSLFTVTFGGWYQRTTLHLSEIYDLLARGKSNLDLSPSKLEAFHQSFGFTSVTREMGDFEYVKAITSSGIEIRYYEDGLYVLTQDSSDIKSAENKLKSYFDNVLHPAISYIFSLGAPTPKVLAAIKNTHPTVISTIKGDLKGLELGDIYSQITSKDYSVYKTPNYIFISATSSQAHLREMVEMQIFFREFKDQLQRYLDLHRQIWEEISDIKERGFIRGAEVEAVRQRLDSYEKTINLIKSRISQMSSYVSTRSSISEKLNLNKDLLSLFQYKYETLVDTHSYIQEIWNMTQDYISTAIQVVNEVQSRSSNNSIDSLRLITTIGVLSGILGYLSEESFPQMTLIGLWYFLILALGTWFVNQVITLVFQKLKYPLSFTDNTLKK